MRSWIFPGGASNDTFDGTAPRKIGEPSGAIAINVTFAGSSWVPGFSPSAFGSGSQTKVTFVLPLSPRDVPTQVRTTDARPGRLTEASAASTGLGMAGFAGAS